MRFTHLLMLLGLGLGLLDLFCVALFLVVAFVDDVGICLIIACIGVVLLVFLFVIVCC